MLDRFKRYQEGLRVEHLFPVSTNGRCSCGCGNVLTGRKKKWYSEECKEKALNIYYIIKGDISVIRYNLFDVEEGFCRNCGVYDPEWQADHIVSVIHGGGACLLDNFQTLCKSCHSEKTLLDRFPNSNNIFTCCLNITPPSYDTIWTFDEGIREHVIRNTVSIS